MRCNLLIDHIMNICHEIRKLAGDRDKTARICFVADFDRSAVKTEHTGVVRLALERAADDICGQFGCGRQSYFTLGNRVHGLIDFREVYASQFGVSDRQLGVLQNRRITRDGRVNIGGDKSLVRQILLDEVMLKCCVFLCSKRVGQFQFLVYCFNLSRIGAFFVSVEFIFNLSDNRFLRFDLRLFLIQRGVDFVKLRLLFLLTVVSYFKRECLNCYRLLVCKVVFLSIQISELCLFC